MDLGKARATIMVNITTETNTLQEEILTQTRHTAVRLEDEQKCLANQSFAMSKHEGILA